MARIDIKSNGTGGGGGGGNLQLASGASMDATLRAVTDTSNTASPLKLSTASVQVNSPLRITTSDASGFYLDAEDSATNNRFSIKRDPSSQEVTLDFASNPAGSTTLVGAIRTYQDGVNLSNAMSFIEDGSVGIGTNTPVGILHIKKTAANTRLAIDGDAGFNRLISYRTGAVQRFGLYVNNTAESGSNAGSDFAIRAYNDAGTLLNTSVFIKRSTGNVGFGTTTPTNAVSIERTTGNSILSLQGNDVTYMSVLRFTNDSQRPRYELYKSRGTIAAPLVVQTGDDIGSVDFNGYDGSANQRVGILYVNAESVSGSTITPQMAFGLGTSAGANIYRMVIKNNGNITIGNDLTTLGARLGIKGSGSTSVTTSLLVQNGSGSNALTVKDDLSVTIGTFNFASSTVIENSTMRLVPLTGGVAINTSYGFANASAILDVSSTTKGFLPPRMTNVQRAAITSPAIGLMVYCTDAVEGLYIYKSTGWTFVI